MLRRTLPWMLCLVAGSLTASEPVRGYFRHPAVQGDRVFFTAEGDLWTVPLAGGKAQRLTTHAQEETRPAPSPDGQWLAFSASYEGPQEAYLMPVGGGLPRRLTFEGGRVQVLGWTPGGAVLVSLQHDQGPAGMRVVATIHPQTLAKQVLPLTDAQDAAITEDGRTLVVARFGLAATGDNARAYRGGAVSELWRLDLKDGKEATRIPLPHPARRPMLWKDKLVYLTDASGSDNLWMADLDGRNPRPLTQQRDFDIRSASLGSGVVVYQLGADLRSLTLATERDQAIAVERVSDLDQMRPRVHRRPLDFLEAARLSPLGDRVVVTARGRVAVGGLQQLRRVEVALPEASRAREATLSRDGAWVYAFCDATGEQELWRFPADGTPGGKALTRDGSAPRLALIPSPDGTWIAHTDRRGRLFILNVSTGDNRLVDSSVEGGHAEVVWSPDSKMLVVTRADTPQRRSQLLLLDPATGRKQVLTSDKYESFSPCFAPDGRWLWFFSNRHFQPTNGGPWGDRNLGPYFDRRTRLYALALQPGNRFPFAPRTELDGAAGDTAPKADKEPKAEKALPALQGEGLETRLHEAPLAPGNYRGLACDGKRLYFLEREEGSVPRTSLRTLEIGNQGASPETFATDLQRFSLSEDGKKVLLVRRNPQGIPDMLVVDAGAKAPADTTKAAVRLGDWSLTLVPPVEWRQMFQDAWRMHREHFYDKKLRGVDWTAVRRKYEPLVVRITDRAELNDLLAQMTAELGALHSQIRPGEVRTATDGATPSFLGAVFDLTPDGVRLRRRYRSEVELPGEMGPLAKPGLDVKEGDLITAINGRPLREPGALEAALANQAGQQVLLTVTRNGQALKPMVVTPVTAERNASLRESDWEEGNRRRVESESKGRVGYVRLRAMTAPDIATFARDFYGQIDREGLVLDVRRNNGGNIDSWVIEKLLRKAWAFWTDNQGNLVGPNMQQTFRGHLVVLVDETTYSDGETFAAGVKALKLGPLVGRRTAGAGVWLSDSNRLVDGGQARVAEMPQFSGVDGRWMLEGKGVEPDIPVENLPVETFHGRDRQLETGLHFLLERLKTEPIPPLKAQPIRPLREGSAH